ncbi:hypothetical protein PsYK624_101970 [Phanerochaete sordida]|uniref:HNH nuclease domain-containing protein n=1 Tax=Phanerochaete sordida TaxID=48140 RepID=A0A9P3LGV3_9APHY|nr:hypothetical protein PsYK624_101970 [Phanerochaete sordida]
MPSLPLPPLSETSMGPSYVDPYIQSAYNSVLDAERRATGSDMDLMHARVIGFLMIALHDFRGTLKLSAIKQVSKGVRSPLTGQVDSAVYELGEMYRVHLLRAFRKSKGSLPPPSQHPSRPSFTTLEDMLKDALDGSGKDHESVKNRALARDGFCCMLSGNYGYDRTSVSRLPELKQSALRMVTTNCCYILSESTLQNVDPEDPECNDNREYTGKVLSVLESFGLGSLVRSVSTLNGIHHLSNVLTMSMQLHDLFDDLSLWLEGTGTPHEYNICVSDQLLMPSDIKERTVRFWVHVKDVDEETLPLPDPALLALHAACARAVNMSGAAEYMDKIDCDAEDLQVLAEDGSSSGILLEKMRSIAVFS